MNQLDGKISEGDFIRNRKRYQALSSLAKDLIEGLMNKDCDNRLTVTQALKHPWLKQEELLEEESDTSSSVSGSNVKDSDDS